MLIVAEAIVRSAAPRRRAQEPQPRAHEVPDAQARRRRLPPRRSTTRSRASRRRAATALRRETREYIAAYRVPLPRHACRRRRGDDGARGYDAWRATNVVDAARRRVLPRDRHGAASATTRPRRGARSRDLAEEYGNGTLRLSNEQNFLLPFVSGAALPGGVRTSRGDRPRRSRAPITSPTSSRARAPTTAASPSRARWAWPSASASTSPTTGLSAEAIGELHVKISGCPNSCGQHHVGDIGLTGMMIKGKDGKERPHYSILVGGHVGEHDFAVGKRLGGRFPEDATPRAHRRRRGVLSSGADGGRAVPRFREAIRRRPTQQDRRCGCARRRALRLHGGRQPAPSPRSRSEDGATRRRSSGKPMV